MACPQNDTSEMARPLRARPLRASRIFRRAAKSIGKRPREFALLLDEVDSEAWQAIRDEAGDPGEIDWENLLELIFKLIEMLIALFT